MVVSNRACTIVSYSILICISISFGPEVNAFTKLSSNFRAFPHFNDHSNSSSITKNQKTNASHSDNKIRNGIQLLSTRLSNDDNSNNLNRRKFLGGAAIIISLLSTLISAVAQAYTSATGYYTFEITEFAKEALEEPDEVSTMQIYF